MADHTDVERAVKAPDPAWQIVDQNGDVVVTADTVAAVARQQRMTPRAVAQHDAKLMVNADAGDAPVFAVPANVDVSILDDPGPGYTRCTLAEFFAENHFEPEELVEIFTAFAAGKAASRRPFRDLLPA
jgi:hypothetical protein